jgi:polar amino acid transport system substrate-binding protein
MKKAISILLSLTLFASLLTACGSASGSTASSGEESQSAQSASAESESTESATQSEQPASTESGTGEVTKVLIGTGGSCKPYIYTDDDGNLVGYEAEIMEHVQELLPQYDFEYEFTEFPSIFLGLDAGQYQMAINNLSWKQEREDKYLFSGEYVGYNLTGAIVRKGYDEIKTLEDLGGKRTYSGESGLFSQVFEEHYNEDHPDNPILLSYTSAETIKQFQDLIDGQIDFILQEKVMEEAELESYPDLLAAVDFIEFTPEETAEIQDPYTWFLYPKTEFGEQLRDDVDGALRQLKEDGTITEIALKWIGYDTTVF